MGCVSAQSVGEAVSSNKSLARGCIFFFFLNCDN